MCGDSTLGIAASRGGAMVAIYMLDSSALLILRFSNTASSRVTNVTSELDMDVSEICVQYVHCSIAQPFRTNSEKQIRKYVGKQSGASCAIDQRCDLSEVDFGCE